ncbi:MAG TPA: M12 family metallo-peptidase [Longimicrobiaceae bacterium]|jgi:hypothetical protein
MKARIALALAASLGLAACQADDNLTPPASSSMSAASSQENFLSLVPQPALNNAQRNLLATIRGRSSTAEVNLARIAGAPGQALQKGAVVRLGLAPGLQVVAVGQNRSDRSADDFSWSGPVRGGQGWVQMVYADGGVTATVTVGNAQYSIEPLGDGLHAVTRIDQHGYPAEHTADNPTGALAEALDATVKAKPGTGGTDGGTVGTQAISTQNVLVVYTASAAAATSNIGSLIQLAVDETNQSYANSGISINMVKVATAQVTYNEAGAFSTHLSRLQGTTDGYMDNVHTLRNTYGADIVVLVLNDSEACGQAAAIKATATSAFAIAHYSCITGYYSFGHEIGHLQGARHDRYVDSSTSPYAYGHGFIPASKSWRTIMAYGNNCNNCTRIQYWSSPLKTYSTGEVMGTVAYEDNARVLNLTAPTVAAFR